MDADNGHYYAVDIMEFAMEEQLYFGIMKQKQMEMEMEMDMEKWTWNIHKFLMH